MNTSFMARHGSRLLANGYTILPIAPGAYSLDVRSESGSFTTSKAVTVVKGENAETEIKRSEFNLGQFAPAVEDEVEINISIEAIKAK